MFHVSLRRGLPAALAVIAAAAAAQPAVPSKARKADPLDPAAAVPAVTYRSSLSGHQRYAEQPVGSWRQANDTVTQIGGWRAYAREAAQSPAPAASAPATPAAAAGHAGHKN